MIVAVLRFNKRFVVLCVECQSELLAQQPLKPRVEARIALLVYFELVFQHSGARRGAKYFNG